MSAFRKSSGALMFGAVLIVCLICQGAPSFAQRSDDALKGITVVGIEVDGVSVQASACGLSREPILAAMTKALTDGGVKVTKDADTDVYLYVNVNTVSPTTGLCVSRYDASVNTYVTATLPYQTQPSLVQVVLAREGGLAGGSVSGHGDAVIKALKQYVDQYTARMRK